MECSREDVVCSGKPPACPIIPNDHDGCRCLVKEFGKDAVIDAQRVMGGNAGANEVKAFISQGGLRCPG